MTAASGIPVKYQEFWAQNAGGAFVRTPPVTTGTPGFASFDQGFPPTNMTLGGVNPFGQDMNGILRSLSQWTQWTQMGGPVAYDATFQGQIGGYPTGALIASASTIGLFWLSTADNNATNPDAAGAGWTPAQAAIIPATGAVLQYTNTTTLTLAPRNGGFLWVNASGQANGSMNWPVPAGLTVSNAGLAANTLYYIYGRVTAGALTIDTPSTTGYAIAANGMPQKSGDVTRTCVGLVATDSGGLFNTNLVRPYFQRPLQRNRTQFSTDRTVSSSSFAEINSEIRNSFVVWAGENVEFHTTGSFSCAANQSAATQISFDGGATEQESVAVAANSSTNRGPCAINGVKTGLSEGLHFATLYGASGAGTATWNGSNTAGTAQVTLIIALQG